MPLNTAAFWGLVFACGLCEAAFLICWRQTWFDSALGVTATLLLLLPLWARRAFRTASAMEHEAHRDRQAVMLASNDMLQRMRAQDSRMLRQVNEQCMALIAENAALKVKLLPYSAVVHPRDAVTGRFVDGPPRTQRTRATASLDRRAVAIITIDQALSTQRSASLPNHIVVDVAPACPAADFLTMLSPNIPAQTRE